MVALQWTQLYYNVFSVTMDFSNNPIFLYAKCLFEVFKSILHCKSFYFKSLSLS